MALNAETLQRYKLWFSSYVKSFYFTNTDDQKNIDLKEMHSGDVCNIITDIAMRHFDAEDKIVLASVIGLFHDVGRFPQYARYKTFKDTISVNHGALGAEVLASEGVLHGLSPETVEIVLQSVKYHNAYSIPNGLSPETEMYLKMIRDADKLGIWRVFIEIFNLNKVERASAVLLGLPVKDGYSEKIFKAVSTGNLAKLKDVECENDYKLLMLTWIFDLNFHSSYSLLLERQYIDALVDTLPDTVEINSLRRILRDYCNARS
ncbi:MAG: HD domain-containing protein [Nitrospirae bacterium YQR-1]